MKRKILARVALCIVAAGTLTGCSDFLSEYSQDMIVAKEVQHFNEVLLGEVYLPSQIKEWGVSGTSVGGFFNILDDDVNTGRGRGLVGMNQMSQAWGQTVAPAFGYYAWQLDVGQNFSGTYTADDNVTWNDFYHRINIINVILDEIVDMPHETDDDRALYWRVQGEARFERALFYFVLANLYGKPYVEEQADTLMSVPLKLTPYVEHDKNKPTQFERASAREVYAQVVDDLKKAIEYLKISPQPEEYTSYRASAEAAELLLSRVYLYMQDWPNAAAMADSVIASRNFQLSGLSSLSSGSYFLSEDNPEIIHSQGSNYLATRNAFNGGPGDFCVSQDLYGLYDQENDKRYSVFFKPNSVTDSIGLSSKYERGSIRSHVSDAFTLRVSEAYLNKAEACAMIPGREQEANDALAELRRNRIVGYVHTFLTGRELVDDIRLERRKELCFEGHRWFDLRRYSVCKTYPYKREIVHVLNVCGEKIDYLYTRVYVLKENDYAYVFRIPKTTLEFDDVPMPDNYREARDYIEIEEPEEDETTGEEGFGDETAPDGGEEEPQP